MFYAVFDIETQNMAIYDSWNEAFPHINGQKVRHMKFSNKEDAQNWLERGALYELKNYDNMSEIQKLKKQYESFEADGLFCDAGKSSKENFCLVNVTKLNGERLFANYSKIIFENSALEVTPEGFIKLPNKTNNYGELMALALALTHIKTHKLNVRHIYSDSSLVINYWSKGIANVPNKETMTLIDQTTKLRKEFEKECGKVRLISGDINPADIGRHKSLIPKIKSL